MCSSDLRTQQVTVVLGEPNNVTLPVTPPMPLPRDEPSCRREIEKLIEDMGSWVLQLRDPDVDVTVRNDLRIRLGRAQVRLAVLNNQYIRLTTGRTR